jgi:hypothetical protein
MQQKRNNLTTTDDDEPRQWAVDRQSAVEVLRIEIAKKRARGSNAEITLPLEIACLIHEAAAFGLHKGQGRKRPRDSRGDKLKKQAIVSWGRLRKAELHAQGMNTTGANSAEDHAAEDARQHAHERYGINLAASTIKRMMQSSED